MKKIFLLSSALFALMISAAAKDAGKTSPAVIEGSLSAIKNDTVRLLFFEDKFGMMQLGAISEIQIIHDGHFKFNIPNITKPGYIRLYSSSANKGRLSLNLNSYIIEPGDNITVSVNDNNDVHFEGRHADKYTCRYALDTLSLFDPGAPMTFISREDVKKDIDNDLKILSKDTGLDKQLGLLARYKDKIPELIYETMKCDLICDNVRGKFNWFLLDWFDAFNWPDSTSRKQKMIEFFDEKINVEPDVAKEAKQLSGNYADLAMIKTNMKIRIDLNQRTISDCRYGYSRIKEYSPAIKDKLMVAFFAYALKTGSVKSIDSCIKDALNIINDKKLAGILSSLNDKTIKGAKAFDFNLMDADHRKIRLNDLKGKTVFVDFWFTGCDACIFCFSKLKKVMSNFSGDTNIVFVSVSIDKNFDKWSQSLHEGLYASEKEEINLYTNGNGDDDPLIKYYDIQGFPALMMIDKNGMIFSASPPRPDGIDGINQLTELIKKAASLIRI